MRVYKVTVIGTGYVGLVTSACLAEIGHQVMGLDIDGGKISQLKNGQIPIYEPGLADLVKRNLGTRLFFTTSYEEAVPWADIVFIAVGTPDDGNGEVELKYLWESAATLVPLVNKPTVLVVKSTVPVGLCDELEEWLHHRLEEQHGPSGRSLVSVVSNPEFLREGRAVGDFLRADRVVIGGFDEAVVGMVKEL